MLPIGAPGSRLNHGAAFALVFIAVLIVWGLLAWLVQQLVRRRRCGRSTALLGAAFGLLRGVVLLLAVATVVALHAGGAVAGLARVARRGDAGRGAAGAEARVARSTVLPQRCRVTRRETESRN